MCLSLVAFIIDHKVSIAFWGLVAGEFLGVPRLDVAYTPSHPYPPVIHERVSLRVVLANFKVGVGQESTFCYRETRRDTQIVGLAVGREELCIRVLAVGG